MMRNLFKKSIDQTDGQYIYVAIDEPSNTLVGFSLFAKQGKMVKLDFYMVDEAWRQHKIDMQLINAALTYFEDIDYVIAGPLQCDKQACALYESLGFVCKGPGPADIMNVLGFSCDTWYFIYELQLKPIY